MTNQNNTFSDENFKYLALKDYIERMLAFYDPMGLIEDSSAPHDEYKSETTKIADMVLNKPIDTIHLSEQISQIFTADFVNPDELKKKSLRMAEDLNSYIKKKC